MRKKNRFKSLYSHHLINGILLFTVLLFAVPGCKKEETTVPVPAKPQKKVVAPIQSAVADEKGIEYQYDPSGKRDPFKPFIDLDK